MKIKLAAPKPMVKIAPPPTASVANVTAPVHAPFMVLPVPEESTPSAFRDDAPDEAPLPPAPAHIGQPVGLPPPPEPLPTDYDGYVALTKRVAVNGVLSKAELWAQLAQAEAQKQVADRLEELLEFLGAYGDSEDEDGNESPRLVTELEQLLTNYFTEPIKPTKGKKS